MGTPQPLQEQDCLPVLVNGFYLATIGFDQVTVILAEMEASFGEELRSARSLGMMAETVLNEAKASVQPQEWSAW